MVFEIILRCGGGSPLHKTFAVAGLYEWQLIQVVNIQTVPCPCGFSTDVFDPRFDDRQYGGLTDNLEWG